MAKKKKEVEVQIPTDGEAQRTTLMLMVKSFYDAQTLRLQTAGRVNRNTGPKTLLDPKDVLMLEEQVKKVESLEKQNLDDIKKHLRLMPFYRDVMEDMPGLGVATSAVILSTFDIRKADTASKMWAFAGLRPMPCRRCSACQNVVKGEDGVYTHTAIRMAFTVKQKAALQAGEKIDREQVPKCVIKELTDANTFESGQAQKPTKGEKLPYSAFLRAKMVGALGSALIRNNTQPWRKMYDDYKHRKLTQGWGVSDGHRAAAATRYMVKMLLLDVWTKWREYEKLPVRPSYHQEKQGGHGFQGRAAAMREESK